MGTSAFGGGDSVIAVQVETGYDSSGIDAARTSFSALGQSSQQAADQLIAAATGSSDAETTLAATAAKASAATSNLTVSTTQMSAALQRAGGDLTRAARLLAEEAAATQAVVLADKEATIATEALIVATEEKAAATATADGQMQKIPGSARTAANAISILAQAATTGHGSMASLANSAGALAFGVGSLVPELALVAAGIGAVVTIGTTLYEVLEHDGEAVTTLGDKWDSLSGKSAGQLKAVYDQESQRLDDIRSQITKNSALIAEADKQASSSAYGAAKVGAPGGGPDPAAVSRARAQNDALYQEAAVYELRLSHLWGDYRTEQGREDDDAARKAQRLAEEQAAREQRLQEQAERQAATLRGTLIEEKAAAEDKLNQSADDAAVAALVRAEQRRELEIAAMRITQAEKEDLLVKSQQATDAKIAVIRKSAQDKANEDAAKVAEKQKEEQLKSLESLVGASASAVEASIKAHESAKQILTKAALAPIVAELEALSKSQAVKAAASFAEGNFAGAAAHAGASVLAEAAAAEVARQGGLGSSGGGSSGSGGGGGSGSTFTPKDQQNQAATVVNLLMQNPYSPEAIQVVSYQLNRNGILNRPLNIPPTRGLVPVGP